jgi:hypothetical protein
VEAERNEGWVGAAERRLQQPIAKRENSFLPIPMTSEYARLAFVSL